MKAKIMTVAAALLAGTLLADEQYLYWMVDVDDAYAFDYATVSTVDTGSRVSVLNNKMSGGSEAGIDIWTSESDRTVTPAVYAYDVTGWENSTFFFELFNENDQRVAYSFVRGGDLSSYIGGSMGTINNPFAVTSVVIPEPTGGTLALLGMAVLALRRRRNARRG